MRSLTWYHISVDKFLKRIVQPDIEGEDDVNGIAASKVHDFTHGINSDPTAILAIVMSALCHDLDHRGCSVRNQKCLCAVYSFL